MIVQGPFTANFLEYALEQNHEAFFLKGKGLREKIEKLHDELSEINLNDDLTEEEVKKFIINPVLVALDWHSLPEQPTDKRTTRAVDYGLFASKEAYDNAKKIKNKDRIKRLNHAATLLEAKKLQANLGREDSASSDSPESQLYGYLDSASRTNKEIDWGILTNGRFWRLYWRSSETASDDYLEIDLFAALGIVKAGGAQGSLFNPDSDLTKADYVLDIFSLFFSPYAFRSSPDDLVREEEKDVQIFLHTAQKKSNEWRLDITEKLSKDILDKTYPELIEIMGKAAKSQKIEGRDLQEAALTFLFRMLFLLYAEDRNLLPVHDLKYGDYSLYNIRSKIDKSLIVVDRALSGIDESLPEYEEIFAKEREKAFQDTYDDSSYSYWKHFTNLCVLIDTGTNKNVKKSSEKELKIPPYNGGLFEGSRAWLLNKIKLSDCDFAKILDGIARADINTPLFGKAWIHFYDLKVRQLGTIYEQLSQYEVRQPYEAITGDRSIGNWEARPNPNLRKTGGVYYTPDDLVRLILDRTLTPLAEECEKKEDPAAALLDLKIVDPAMGSGHFLVGAVDWLAKRVERAIRKSVEDENPSSVLKKINTFRNRIEENAEEGGWKVDGNKNLSDSNLIRRMVLKRCIHGVDKSYYAVEIAKLSLWLHSFTVGAPLSYLDHHIQHGDSLFGEFLNPMSKQLYQNVGAMTFPNFDSVLKDASDRMEKIEKIADIDPKGVKTSKEEFEKLQKETEGYRATFAFLHALRWVYPEFWGVKKKGKNKTQSDKELIGKIDDWIRSHEGVLPARLDEENLSEDLKNALPQIYELINEEHFFAWELAFPHIWQDVTSDEPKGGFDAVISNPPWERVKLQNREWFEIRDEEIAKASNRSVRDKMIAGLKRQGDPLYGEYEKFVKKHEDTARVARDGGYYPLLSRGDINYYALFVERAQSLIQSNGLVGMVTPSGLAADQTCANFFKLVSTNGRVACLFDFENRRAFFPDVHRQFRFLISVIGGDERKFRKTDCAFFLRSVLEIEGGTDKKTARTYKARGFSLTAKDFSLVNPNTGTAPLFKNKQDADLVLAVYRRLPALHNHTKKNLTWPVRCSTMFHMTSASHLFRTEKELTEQGFKRVANKNILHYEKKDYVPLYQGRMVYQFDHRFSTVKINTENLYNPYVTEVTTAQEHADPKFLPEPHNWIPQEEFAKKVKTDMQYFLAFRNITNATNERTMISAIAPRVGFGNSASVLLPLDGEEAKYKECLPILCANFNSLALDYIARCKLQGTNMNWYLVEQLPVIPPETLNETKIGGLTAHDLVWRDSFRLTYTAHDLDSFGRDQGWNRGPFIWNPEERIQLRARLDALFFILYGFTNKNDIQHILDSFAVIGKRNAEQRSAHKRMSTLIFEYLDKFQNGNPNPWLSDALPYPEMGD